MRAAPVAEKWSLTLALLFLLTVPALSRQSAVIRTASKYAATLDFNALVETTPGERVAAFRGARIGSSNFSFIFAATAPQGGPPLHQHDEEEAHIVYEGRVRYIIGDEQFTLEAPFVVRIPARTPHAFLNVGPNPIRVTGVFASPKGGRTDVIGPNPLVK